MMKRKFFKVLAVFLSLNILTETFFPVVAYALTSGPSQPEVQSFEPIGTSEMVDVFSGDFVYNIPLLDVGGYPVNISYHGGVTMDQEASWVGLGWNINPGVINRNMRGLPDDFDGSRDKITKQLNYRPNRTYGVTGSAQFAILGKDKKPSGAGLSLGLGLSYNNYKGFGFEMSVSPSISAAVGSKGSLNMGLGLKSSSNDGLSVSPSISYESQIADQTEGNKVITTRSSMGVSSSYNARSGLKTLTLDFSTRTSSYNIFFPKRISKTTTESSNGGSTITFGTPTYIPQVTTPMVSASVLMSAKFLAEATGAEPGFGVSGYYSEQKLNPRMKTQVIPAYGYLYSEKANGNSLQDFNREKDAGFSLNTPALPLTNYTYDVYSVSGQGVGGMYRPYRSEVGQVYDKYVSSTSESYSVGLEFGAGNLVKFGGDLAINDIYTNSRNWVNHNKLGAHLKFNKKNPSEHLFEPYYFKQAGEKSVDAEYENAQSFFYKAGESDPVRAVLVAEGRYEVGTSKTLVRSELGPNSVTLKASEYVDGPIKRDVAKRQKRNENISLLTIAQAKELGINKSLYCATGISSCGPELPVDERVYGDAHSHHIGEITALKADGSRYIYGIPAYNYIQEEVTFNSGEGVNDNKYEKLGVDPMNGLLTYHHDINKGDNSMENKRGLDHFFSKTTTPAYAHSYFLTAVLSPDYVDNDGVDGPSENDMGHYTKFNYKKNTASNRFRWRVPMGTNTATANEGLTSKTDDQGSYIYGEKEVWYLESIENKNYIAFFEKVNRADGLGVTGEEGTIDENNRLKMLKSIKLYFKDEYNKKGLNATPIKTVHFEYDYSLCTGIPNSSNTGLTEEDTKNILANQGGKLTLKKIYFTYQNSNRAKFSPYEFTYCDPEHDGTINPLNNPSYNLKAYDRWGNYKPVIVDYNTNSDYKTNSDFPYVIQDKPVADLNTSAWALTKIDLPSGGNIKVDYESDDYAYVQDRPAMEMAKISGISKAMNEEEAGNFLYTDALWGEKHKMVLHVDLRVPVSGKDEFYKKYLKGVDQIYFKVKVNLGNPGESNFEFVTGYAQIDGSNYEINANGTKAYIKLKSVSLGEKKDRGLQLNPITMAALQFCRIYTPKIAHGETDATDSGFEQVFKSLLNSNILKNIGETILGVNRTLLRKNFCRNIDLQNAYVRLLSPERAKLGGGYRVRQIRMNDRASGFQMGADTEYGQTYDYKTTDPDTGEEISSGVASYEPILGNEENPFRQPVAFLRKKQEKLLVPDDRFFLEEPFGESFFPAPSVGYSKVTVKNFGASESVTRSTTGKIIHEFYTAKDFPIITKRTDLQVMPKKSPQSLRLLRLLSLDYMNASQGYVIELNDMHGKPKAQWVYAEGKNNQGTEIDKETPISGIVYKYKSNGNKLENKVPVINSLGQVREANIGVDFDMITDMREQETEATMVGLNGNLAAFLAAIFPGIVPLFLPAYTKEHTRFRSAVITKVINRYGLLEETIAYDLGSSVSTKNIGFDSETGEILLTQTKNDFEDDVYNLTFPAHWAYDRMGQAYKNIGVEGTATFSQGIATNINPALFTEGDELIILKNTVMDNPGTPQEIRNHKGYRFWITRVASDHIKVMGGTHVVKATYEIEGNTTFKVIRSGRRNLQNIPVGSVVCLENPIRNASNASYKNLDLEVYNHKILAAGSTEFSEDWQQYCCIPDKFEHLNKYNRYYAGIKGNWRLKKTYTMLTGRDQTPVIANTRHDGVFASFTSFWNPPVSGQWIKDDINWRWVTEVTAYDLYGSAEIENMDALGRYSAAKNSHNHMVPRAVSSNAKQHEIFFDSFEDENYEECTESFYKEHQNKINLDFSHSGRRSIKIPMGENTPPVQIEFDFDCPIPE